MTTPNLQSLLVALLIIAGGGAFTLAAATTGVAGLPKLMMGITCWLLAWHFVRLGRLY